MEQVYKMHSLLKHFRKPGTINDTLGMKESEERVTIGGEESDKECCICFDNKASMVLPCMVFLV
jgi:hypothetical protein